MSAALIAVLLGLAPLARAVERLPDLSLALSPAPHAQSALPADLAGHLFHDLRSPLTVVLATSQLMHMQSVRDNGPIAAQRALGNVLESARAMKATIERFDGGRVAALAPARFDSARRTLMSQLLELSLRVDSAARHFDGSNNLVAPMQQSLLTIQATLQDYRQLFSERGKSLALSRKRLYAGDLLREAAGAVASEAASRRIAIQVEVPEGLKVLGNKPALKIALHNLLANAVKYTPEGGRITLRASVDPERPDYALVSVGDNGIGIAAEDQESVFDGLRTEAGQAMAEGTGKGLRSVKQLVEANGSAIGLASSPGQGSEFSFELPIAP